MTFVSDTRTMLRSSLLSYGEHDLARRVQFLSDVEIGRIREIAREHYASLGVPKHPAGPSNRLTCKVSKADSLAAVQVMEGARRPLKRKRRLPYTTVWKLKTQTQACCWREPWHEEDAADPKAVGLRFAEARRALLSRLLEISDTPGESLERKKLESVLCLLEDAIKENDKRNEPK